MPVFLIVVVVLVVILAVAAVAMGMFRIIKVEVEPSAPPDPDENNQIPADKDAQTPTYPDESALTLKEKMENNGLLDPLGDDPATAQGETAKQYDRISGFESGRGFFVEGQKLLNQAKSEGLMYAAVCFDLDRFRFINRLKGYSIGDYVLTKLSHEIVCVFPQGTLFTRFSADHFAALFPLSDMDMFAGITDNVKELCEKIRGDIAAKGVLRICMGAAVTHNIDRDYDISVLIHKANIARHCNKGSRDENFKLYEDSILTSGLYDESALEDYSDNQYDDEFSLYYAPQDDPVEHKLVGCEALARWVYEDEVDGALPTHIDKNRLPTNGTKVIYQVCKAMSRWRKAGKEVLPVCIPINLADLHKDDIDGFLAKCLSEFQIEPAMLSVVLAAPMIRMDWSSTAKQVRKIRDIGVKIGVDEIDTGYSGLEFLSGLPINFIKLHRSFAAKIDQSEEQQSLAKNMLQAASALNLAVYFEGVDTAEQANTLSTLGACRIQGKYCGKPQSSDEFAQGLPEYIQRLDTHESTVILEDAALNKGDFSLF